MPSCKIIKPGLYTSLQDKGRVGMAYYAIPPSGVMDSRSADLANSLVGNPNGHPVIECCLKGPSIQFQDNTTIAITGSQMGWKIDGELIPMNTAVEIKANSMLSSSFRTKYLYAFIAIRGEIETTYSYNSCSVYPPAKLGHQEGHSFQAGDILKWDNTNSLAESLTKQRIFSSDILITKGPEFHFLAEESMKILTSTNWAKSVDSNRMGARLTGPKLTSKNILKDSVPVLPGHIQLPPSGQPIVVLQDGQTTGGYPRIGFIDSNSLDDFNQVGLREVLKFSLSL